MLTAGTFEIDGINFSIMPMPIMEARKWDFKIARLLVPLLGALDGFKESDEAPKSEEGEQPAADEDKSVADSIGMAKVAEAVQKALSTLSDAEVDAMITGMTSRVTALVPGAAPRLLSERGAMDEVFAGMGPIGIYKLLFEVARYNKFSPFALGGAGSPVAGLLQRRTGFDLSRLAP